MLPDVLKDRPATLTVSGSSEDWEAIVRAKKSGLVFIHGMKVGRTNAEWILELSYPQPQQRSLFDVIPE